MQGTGTKGKLRTQATRALPRPAGVLCGEVVRRGWVVGTSGPGGRGGAWERSRPSQKETAPWRGSRWHSSEDSCEMPSSPSSSSVLGLPLGFFPGVLVVFRVLAAPLFLLPFGRPRGLLGVGTSLGSFCKDKGGSQGHTCYASHLFRRPSLPLLPLPKGIGQQAISPTQEATAQWQGMPLGFGSV